jgi:SAM-dependent methyltransferase
MTHDVWEELGSREAPSWYLDPLVARQKRAVHLAAAARWLAGVSARTILKTDLFEEAFGEDHLLLDLAPEAPYRCGMEESLHTTAAAGRRFPALRGKLVVTDIRCTGIRGDTFDAVISTSTLDHFRTRAEFLAALDEIQRLLRPGGKLLLTLDNPWNPLYAPLRLLSGTRFGPFPLGYTPSMRTLWRDLAARGFTVRDKDWLIHNPRLLSTVLFLLLRRLGGSRADTWIGWLLRVFALLGKLPTRRFTSCFQAVAAEKRSSVGSPIMKD